MEQRVLVAENNSVTVVCPKCNATKTAGVSQFKSLDRRVTLKVTCTCENVYSVFLERRRSYRKELHLSGNFVFKPSGGRLQQGKVSVMNISQGGLQLEFNVMPKIKVGEIFEVEFTLDDKQQTLIKKEVAVKRVADKIVGVKFCSIDPSDPSDKAIGFYLF